MESDRRPEGRDWIVSGSSEVVNGVIPANARLGIGFEQLHLVITDRRIIVAHGAKKGAGGLASVLVLGSHSGAFGEPNKPGISLTERSTLEGVKPENVLASNRDNFEIDYAELVSVEVDDGPSATSIALVTGSDKFQFFTRMEATEVSGLLAQHLGTRITTRKHSTR